jgi:hypothetical protein
MKKLPLLILLLVLFNFTHAEYQWSPKNMKRAIQFLDKDCPDSLKSVIKITANDKLEHLIYPLGGKYKTIYSWTNGGNQYSSIVKYLSNKGIHSNQEVVILIAFKEHLLGKQLDEKAIYAPWIALEKKNENEDAVRFTTDSLRGFYIPRDLDDCIKRLNILLSDSSKANAKRMTEKQFTGSAHLALGMWMRNNWQLWGGSRLSAYFNKMEIYHPDDMSGIILDTYHRYLNNEDFRLDEQIATYHAYWTKAKADELVEKQQEFDEFKVGDTVKFKYQYGYISQVQERKDDDEVCIAKGVVEEKDSKCFFIKVRVVESYDKKGIVIYDSENVKVYDNKVGRLVTPVKRVRKYIKAGKSYWSNYNDWISMLYACDM